MWLVLSGRGGESILSNYDACFYGGGVGGGVGVRSIEQTTKGGGKRRVMKGVGGMRGARLRLRWGGWIGSGGGEIRR